jgi:hypothetical protein
VGWRVSYNSAPARGEVPAGLWVLAPGGLRPIRKPPSMSVLKAAYLMSAPCKPLRWRKHDAVAVEVPGLAKFSALLLCRRGALVPCEQVPAEPLSGKVLSAVAEAAAVLTVGRCCCVMGMKTSSGALTR